MCVPAYFRHSFTYFLVFLHIYCIFTVFCAYICISLIVSAYFVQCISQFCRSFPVPFLFHFTAKAADQQFIASKHTHSSGQANLSPARAQGKAFAMACSSWHTVFWPIDYLSLHQLQLENLISQDATLQGQCSSCHCSSSSSHCSRVSI